LIDSFNKRNSAFYYGVCFVFDETFKKSGNYVVVLSKQCAVTKSDSLLSQIVRVASSFLQILSKYRFQCILTICEWCQWS